MLPTDGFDARNLESRLAWLDKIPAKLLPHVVCSPLGQMQERAETARHLMDCLAEGIPPAERSINWPPDPRWRSELTSAIRDLGIARFTPGMPDIALQFTRDAFDVVEDAIRVGETTLREALARAWAAAAAPEPASRQDQQTVPSTGEAANSPTARMVTASTRLRRGEAGGPRVTVQVVSEKDRGKPSGIQLSTIAPEPVQLTDAARARAEAEAKEASVASLRRRIFALWQERVSAWSQLASVFGELGLLLGCGWDLTQGVLRHVGWDRAAELAKLLERQPRFLEVVEQLGRLSASTDESDSVVVQLLEPMSRAGHQEVLRETPLVAADTKGVTLSDDLSRMLASESVLLGHPRFRSLFLARWVEHRLMTYQVSGVSPQRMLAELPGESPVDRRVPRDNNRGPIVAVLDTSGSMAGYPETVAKALVLGALRIAHREKRKCLLLSFSGPGNIAELDLSLTPEGLGRLLDFLARSFDGGTDLSAPVQRVAELLSQDPRFGKADVLLVSDGFFQVSGQHRSTLAKVRSEHGTRVHGVGIGRWDMEAMRSLCDCFHRFEDWSLKAR